MTPPEKQDAQVVDNQRNIPILVLGSLPPAGRGWSANALEHRAGASGHCPVGFDRAIKFDYHIYIAALAAGGRGSALERSAK
jgi:hypothetical protein